MSRVFIVTLKEGLDREQTDDALHAIGMIRGVEEYERAASQEKRGETMQSDTVCAYCEFGGACTFQSRDNHVHFRGKRIAALKSAV